MGKFLCKVLTGSTASSVSAYTQQTRKCLRIQHVPMLSTDQQLRWKLQAITEDRLRWAWPKWNF